MGSEDWSEHFVNFDISIQWELASGASPSGSFQVLCPESFPLDLHTLDFPIRKGECCCNRRIDTCVDNFFVDCAFRNSFIFKLRYRPSRHHNKSKSSTKETVLLDANVLFMKNRKDVSVTCQLSPFERVIFTVKVDEELLSEDHIERFCPTILYVSTIEHIPRKDEKYAPVFLTCKIGDVTFNVKPREIEGTTCKIDTVIVIAPRVDTPVVFEIHDRDSSLPAIESFRGSGLYTPFEAAPVKEEEQADSDSEEVKQEQVAHPEEETKKSEKKHKRKRRKEQVPLEPPKEEKTETIKPIQAKQQQEPKPQPQLHLQRVPFITASQPHFAIKPKPAPKPEPEPEKAPVKEKEKEKKPEPEATTKQKHKKPKEKTTRAPGHGVCKFQLLQKKNLHENITPSDPTTSSDFTQTILTGTVLDPGSKYPTPSTTAPIERPTVVHKRPVPIVIEPVREEDGENPDILSMEHPETTRLVRWIITCRRGDECASDVLDFVNHHHRSVISHWAEEQMSFERSFRRCADIITGVHITTPKEELIVLESRLDERTRASEKLEQLLRQMPNDLHILGNMKEIFRAPRLYCCFDRLIKHVEIPITVDELLQIQNLYFKGKDNHILYPIATKLRELIVSPTISEARKAGSFPSFSEIRLLAKRAFGLFTTPLERGFPVLPVQEPKHADFGDSVVTREVNTMPDVKAPLADALIPPVVIVKHDDPPEKERLTRYTLTRPLSQRGAPDGRRTAQPVRRRFSAVEAAAHTVRSPSPPSPSPSPEPRHAPRRNSDLRRKRPIC